MLKKEKKKKQIVPCFLTFDNCASIDANINNNANAHWYSFTCRTMYITMNIYLTAIACARSKV
jgi:hypothetical protein